MSNFFSQKSLFRYMYTVKRINTEEKAKVIAVVWGTEFMHKDDFEE